MMRCLSFPVIFTFLAVVDFLDYRPSTVAAAAVLYAAQEISDISARYNENAGIFSELLSKVDGHRYILFFLWTKLKKNGNFFFFF